MSLVACTPYKRLSLAPEISPAVLSAISRGEFQGEGSFAACWTFNGTALKLSCDIATCAMAQLLSGASIPGLPVVHSVIENAARYENVYYDALFMEKLTPLPAARFQALAAAYARAKERAMSQYKRVPKQSVALARSMAEELAVLKTRALTPYNVESLMTGLCWLAQFMEGGGFCADFGHRRNWMVNGRNEVVIADPVVARIPELDAESSLGSPLTW